MIFRGASFEVAAAHGDFDDEAEVRERHWNPAPGDLVLDVGAGRGSYTLTALALGARVIAFSPEVRDTLLLRANLEANPVFSDRCLVMEGGLYSKDGRLVLNPSWSAYEYVDDHREGEDVPGFPVVTLDSLGIEGVNWIKIDVEGGELHVLQGAEETIRRCRPRVIVENHQFMDKEMELKTAEFMLRLDVGYTCVVHGYNSVSHGYFEVPGHEP